MHIAAVATRVVPYTAPRAEFELVKAGWRVRFECIGAECLLPDPLDCARLLRAGAFDLGARGVELAAPAPFFLRGRAYVTFSVFAA